MAHLLEHIKAPNHNTHKTMKLKLITGLAISALSLTVANATTIVWAGGSGDFATGGNWVGGTAPNLNNTDVAQISAGTATYNVGAGDLNVIGANSGVDVNGGNYTQTAGNWVDIRGGATLSISSGGTFSGMNNLRLRGVGGNSATHTVNNGTINSNGLVLDDVQTLNVSNGSTLNINGTVDINNAGILNLAGSTASFNNLNLLTYGGQFGQLNLNSGQLNVSNSFSTVAGAYVNFSTGSTGVMFIDGTDIAAAEALITGGNFGINGAADTTVANYKLTTNGAGVNIELTPEPSSAALLGLGGLALILRRRK